MRLGDVTAVVINYRTPDLTEACIRGLLSFYPGLPLVLVENDSSDRGRSEALARDLMASHQNVSVVFNHRNLGDSDAPLPRIGCMRLAFGGGNRRATVLDDWEGAQEPFLKDEVVRDILSGGNVGHGPALHQALTLCKTPYLLALDSDCIVNRGGFVERMLEPFEADDVYAVGRRVWLDKRGTAQPPERAKRRRFDEHIHEAVILLDVAKYRTVLPYVHFGVPSILTMVDAMGKGYNLAHYDIGKEGSEVHHLFKGSRKRLGRTPKARSLPIMPWVFLRHLESEFEGPYW